MVIIVYNGKGLSQIKYYRQRDTVVIAGGFKSEKYGLIKIKERFDVIFDMFASNKHAIEINYNTVYRFNI